jgi:hypothetical protein
MSSARLERAILDGYPKERGQRTLVSRRFFVQENLQNCGWGFKNGARVRSGYRRWLATFDFNKQRALNSNYTIGKLKGSSRGYRKKDRKGVRETPGGEEEVKVHGI